MSALAASENCAQMLPLLVQLVHQQRLAATALVIAVLATNLARLDQSAADPDPALEVLSCSSLAVLCVRWKAARAASRAA